MNDIAKLPPHQPINTEDNEEFQLYVRRQGDPRAFDVHRVLAGIRAGLSLMKSCEAIGLDQKTWWRWCEIDPGLREATVKSQEVGTHAIAQEILDITNEVPPDRDCVAKARLQIKARLDLIRAWNRAFYGRDVQIQTASSLTITTTPPDGQRD